MLRCIRAFVVIETNANWSKWAFILALSVMMTLDHANKPYSATITVDHMAFLTIWSISVWSKFHGFVRNQEKVSQAYKMSVSSSS